MRARLLLAVVAIALVTGMSALLPGVASAAPSGSPSPLSPPATAHPAGTAATSLTNWTQVCPGTTCPNSPGTSLSSLYLIYDPETGYTVDIPEYAWTDVTWVYADGEWTSLATSPQVGLTSGCAAYDAKDEEIVLFGGYTGSTPQNTTYVFQDGSWSPLTPASASNPVARWQCAMTWDAADGYVLMYGGYEEGGTGLADTWSFLAGEWSEVSATSTPGRSTYGPIGFDDGSNSVVMVTTGGASTHPGYTWSYAAGTWTEESTANPFVDGDGQYSSYDFAWDPQTHSTLLTGCVPTSSGGTGAVQTYEWVNGSYILLNPYDSPPACGSTEDGSEPGETYDAHDGYLIAFFFGADGETWNFTSVPMEPLTAKAFASPAVTDVGLEVNYTGVASGGTPPYAYAWRFGDGGASMLQDPQHAFDAAGTYVASFWVNDSAGASAVTTTSVQVDPGLAVVASENRTMAEVDDRFNFNATTAGGTAPLVLSWRWGDGSGAGGTDLSHEYTSPGTYSARVWANDSVGASATSNVSLTVVAPPVISAVAAPNPTQVNEEVSFGLIESGGIAPYTYSWSFGDGGSSTLEDPFHAYATVGTYVVNVDVVDAEFRSASSSLTVRVVNTTGCSSVLSSVALDPRSVNLGYGRSQVVTAYPSDDCGDPLSAGVSYAWTLSSPSLGGLNSSSTDPVNFTAGDTTENGTLCVRAAYLGTDVSVCDQVNVTPTGGPGSPVIHAFTVEPSNTIDLGASVSFVVDASGGVPPLDYVYVGLPAGCATADLATLPCTPTASGVYVVSVLVIDASGATVSASATLTVNTKQPISNPNNNPWAFGSPLFDLLLVVVGVVIALVVAFLLVARRRKERPPPTAQTSAPSPGSPYPPPPGASGPAPVAPLEDLAAGPAPVAPLDEYTTLPPPSR